MVQRGTGNRRRRPSGGGLVASPARRTRPAAIRIGCSGWQYRHWRGNFYPADLPARRWFEHYATIFDTVEVNNSFYRLPEAATFQAWASRAPAAFTFAVKASRFLTHMKKLKDPDAPVRLFFERARELGRHLGPVLYQLPPGWKLNLARLEQFLQVLPRDVQHVLEFRDATWQVDEVYRLMNDHGVALCLHDMRGSATGRLRVGPFIYARFHGSGARYGGAYSAAQLEPWATWLAEHAVSGVPAYAYFNNDLGGHAPRDAQLLRTLVSTQHPAPST